MDADWAGCLEDRRSYTGFVFLLAHGAVSWEAKKQRKVALSRTEAEYMALTEAAKEAVHLQRFLKEIGLKEQIIVPIYNDNEAAQKLSKNPLFHLRSKHRHPSPLCETSSARRMDYLGLRSISSNDG